MLGDYKMTEDVLEFPSSSNIHVYMKNSVNKFTDKLQLRVIT
jgi:hypothetical protein